MAQHFFFLAAEKELYHGDADIRDSMDRPLDDASVEVARKVRKWSVLVAGKRSHTQRRLLGVVDQLELPDVPDDLQGVVAA